MRHHRLLRPLILSLLVLAASTVRAGEGLHALLDDLLTRYVVDGHVSYAGFQQEEAQLDEYLAGLDSVDPAALSRDEQLALWINAYNAYTVKLILSRYPDIRSIKDISRPWDRRLWRVGGETYSLNDIEHRILRKEFDEPRIHFAINCASISCPDLRSEAYVAEQLEQQLQDASVRFLADTEKGLRTASRRRLFLSRIFMWFSGDFGDVVDFVEPLTTPAARAFIQEHQGSLRVKYLAYDWDLNGE